jgi:hypothetical protein
MKRAFLAIVLVAFAAGCASVPGETREEQVQTIDELVERTLSDLYKEEPATRQEIAGSAGYAIMSNKITKILRELFPVSGLRQLKALRRA